MIIQCKINTFDFFLNHGYSSTTPYPHPSLHLISLVCVLRAYIVTPAVQHSFGLFHIWCHLFMFCVRVLLLQHYVAHLVLTTFEITCSCFACIVTPAYTPLVVVIDNHTGESSFFIRCSQLTTAVSCLISIRKSDGALSALNGHVTFDISLGYSISTRLCSLHIRMAFKMFFVQSSATFQILPMRSEIRVSACNVRNVFSANQSSGHIC